METPMNKWDDLGGCFHPPIFRKESIYSYADHSFKKPAVIHPPFSTASSVRFRFDPRKVDKKEAWRLVGPDFLVVNFWLVACQWSHASEIRKFATFFFKNRFQFENFKFHLSHLVTKAKNVGGQLALLVQYLPKSSEGIGILRQKKSTTFLLKTGMLENSKISPFFVRHISEIQSLFFGTMFNWVKIR